MVLSSRVEFVDCNMPIYCKDLETWSFVILSRVALIKNGDSL